MHEERDELREAAEKSDYFLITSIIFLPTDFGSIKKYSLLTNILNVDI